MNPPLSVFQYYVPKGYSKPKPLHEMFTLVEQANQQSEAWKIPKYISTNSEEPLNYSMKKCDKVNEKDEMNKHSNQICKSNSSDLSEPCNSKPVEDAMPVIKDEEKSESRGEECFIKLHNDNEHFKNNEKEQPQVICKKEENSEDCKPCLSYGEKQPEKSCRDPENNGNRKSCAFSLHENTSGENSEAKQSKKSCNQDEENSEENKSFIRKLDECHDRCSNCKKKLPKSNSKNISKHGKEPCIIDLDTYCEDELGKKCGNRKNSIRKKPCVISLQLKKNIKQEERDTSTVIEINDESSSEDPEEEIDQGDNELNRVQTVFNDLAKKQKPGSPMYFSIGNANFIFNYGAADAKSNRKVKIMCKKHVAKSVRGKIDFVNRRLKRDKKRRIRLKNLKRMKMRKKLVKHAKINSKKGIKIKRNIKVSHQYDHSIGNSISEDCEAGNSKEQDPHTPKDEVKTENISGHDLEEKQGNLSPDNHVELVDNVPCEVSVDQELSFNGLNFNAKKRKFGKKKKQRNRSEKKYRNKLKKQMKELKKYCYQRNLFVPPSERVLRSHVHPSAQNSSDCINYQQIRKSDMITKIIRINLPNTTAVENSSNLQQSSEQVRENGNNVSLKIENIEQEKSIIESQGLSENEPHEPQTIKMEYDIAENTNIVEKLDILQSGDKTDINNDSPQSGDKTEILRLNEVRTSEKKVEVVQDIDGITNVEDYMNPQVQKKIDVSQMVELQNQNRQQNIPEDVATRTNLKNDSHIIHSTRGCKKIEPGDPQTITSDQAIKANPDFKRGNISTQVEIKNEMMNLNGLPTTYTDDKNSQSDVIKNDKSIFEVSDKNSQRNDVMKNDESDVKVSDKNSQGNEVMKNDDSDVQVSNRNCNNPRIKSECDDSEGNEIKTNHENKASENTKNPGQSLNFDNESSMRPESKMHVIGLKQENVGHISNGNEVAIPKETVAINKVEKKDFSAKQNGSALTSKESDKSQMDNICRKSENKNTISNRRKNSAHIIRRTKNKQQSVNLQLKKNENIDRCRPNILLSSKSYRNKEKENKNDVVQFNQETKNQESTIGNITSKRTDSHGSNTTNSLTDIGVNHQPNHDEDHRNIKPETMTETQINELRSKNRQKIIESSRELPRIIKMLHRTINCQRDIENRNIILEGSEEIDTCEKVENIKKISMGTRKRKQSNRNECNILEIFKVDDCSEPSNKEGEVISTMTNIYSRDQSMTNGNNQTIGNEPNVQLTYHQPTEIADTFSQQTRATTNNKDNNFRIKKKNYETKVVTLLYPKGELSDSKCNLEETETIMNLGNNAYTGSQNELNGHKSPSPITSLNYQLQNTSISENDRKPDANVTLNKSSCNRLRTTASKRKLSTNENRQVKKPTITQPTQDFDPLANIVDGIIELGKQSPIYLETARGISENYAPLDGAKFIDAQTLRSNFANKMLKNPKPYQTPNYEPNYNFPAQVTTTTLPIVECKMDKNKLNESKKSDCIKPAPVPSIVNNIRYDQIQTGNEEIITAAIPQEKVQILNKIYRHKMNEQTILTSCNFYREASRTSDSCDGNMEANPPQVNIRKDPRREARSALRTPSRQVIQAHRTRSELSEVRIPPEPRPNQYCHNHPNIICNLNINHQPNILDVTSGPTIPSSDHPYANLRIASETWPENCNQTPMIQPMYNLHPTGFPPLKRVPVVHGNPIMNAGINNIHMPPFPMDPRGFNIENDRIAFNQMNLNLARASLEVANHMYGRFLVSYFGGGQLFPR